LNSTRPGLDFLDRLGGVLRHGAGFGIGHQPARSERFAQFAHLGHGIRRGDGHVEIRPTFVAFLNQILESDKFRPGRAGGIGGGAGLGEHQHPHGLAAAMRQGHRAPDHLVRLLGIDPQFEGHVNGFIELGLGKLGEDLDGRTERINFSGFDQFAPFFVSFAWHNMERCKRVPPVDGDSPAID
jgi:hypothetical protein